jgi:hypothetical protein
MPVVSNRHGSWGENLRALYFDNNTPRRTGELDIYLRIAQKFGSGSFVLPFVVLRYCLRRRWLDGISALNLSRD